MRPLMQARRWLSPIALSLALGAISTPVFAQDLPVGTIVNFGPDLQTAAGGVCRQPEGIAIDPDGNFYLSSNSDSATTVGHVCVLNSKGQLTDIINVGYTQFVNPPRITLTLRQPGRFGREVSFSPPQSFLAPFARNKLASELIERVEAARRR